MPTKNRYQITCNYQHKTRGWEGWVKFDVIPAEDWQNAIQEWLDLFWATGRYTVISETLSEDDRSGINEIQFDAPYYYVSAKVKATLIKDD